MFEAIGGAWIVVFDRAEAAAFVRRGTSCAEDPRRGGIVAPVITSTAVLFLGSALLAFLIAVAATGANVESIEHDRARSEVAVGKAEVLLRLDTRGAAHVAEVILALTEKGYRVARE